MQKYLGPCFRTTMAADPRCADCIVRGALQHNPSPQAHLHWVLQRSKRYTLPAKRILYRQNAPAEMIYMLRQGTVKMEREDPNGRMRQIRWVGSGTAVGLVAVLSETYQETATAIEPIEFCRIPLSVIQHLQRSACDVCTELMRQWQANMEQADCFVFTLAAGTAFQRLARLLLRLADIRDGTHCPVLRRQDIGDALGVSMETASRLIAEFRRRGLIQAAGRELMLDPARLRDIAAGSPVSAQRTLEH